MISDTLPPFFFADIGQEIAAVWDIPGIDGVLLYYTWGDAIKCSQIGYDEFDRQLKLDY